MIILLAVAPTGSIIMYFAVTGVENVFVTFVSLSVLASKTFPPSTAVQVFLCVYDESSGPVS